MLNAIATFRFDAADHAYYLGDVRVPSITQMLATTGRIDDRWYTEQSSERGTAVHDLTARYDLGALDVESCAGKYRGWLLAYVTAMRALRPKWADVEMPGIHPDLRFGGRPDRVGQAFGLKTILEIKSGGVEKSHRVQTALQAILVSASKPLPAEAWQRYAIYIKENGKFSLEQHKDRGDFDEAYSIIRSCTR